MEQHWQFALVQRRPERLELWRVQRLLVDVGEDYQPDHVQIVNSPLHLADGKLDVLERHAGEATIPVGPLFADRR